MKARLWHAAVHVSDLDRSVEFYKKALGLHEIRRDHPEETLSIARLADETEAMCLEVMCDKTMDPKEFGGEGWHMGLRCDPIEEWREFHREMGVIIEEHPEMNMYFIADPDGNRIEFVPEKK